MVWNNPGKVATILGTSWKAFGPKDLLFTGASLGALSAGRATMALDRIFYRDFEQVEVKRPVFILGHPRSGTTFLHRLITQTDEFPAFRTWELLVPSLTARKLIRPAIPAVTGFMGKGFKDDSALFAEGSHETSADSIEEEELLFLMRLDTQFTMLFSPLGFDEEDHPDVVFGDSQPRDERMASMDLFEACLKRQILATGCKQVVAKMPYSTLRARTLLEAFPDARFIYMVRSPFETIPSHLSLHRNFFRQRYGLDGIPEARLARYWDRRYRFNVALYRYFHEVQAQQAIPDEQLMVVTYPQIKEDLQGVFDRFLSFSGAEVSDTLRARIGEQAARQKDYRRTHKNLSLEEFGLSRQRVLDDLGFVFDTYGFPTDTEAG